MNAHTVQYSPPPNNWKLSPQWVLPLISQPGVNFTACNLHMFIYRNLIYVISDSPFSHMLKCSHPHTITKTHTHIPDTDIPWINTHAPTWLGIVFKFSVTYTEAENISSGSCREPLGDIRRTSPRDESYFTENNLDFSFKKSPTVWAATVQLRCWAVTWAGITYCRNETVAHVTSGIRSSDGLK